MQAFIKVLFLAVIQGITEFLPVSRSGSTIVVARHLGISPEKAAEFSFLLSIPVLTGAAIIKIIEIAYVDLGNISLISLIAGMVVSACIGYVAIVCLVKSLVCGKFWLFGVYCLIMGVIMTVVLFL